jgi:hypothetical protein
MAVIEIIALGLGVLVIILVIGIFAGPGSDRGIGGRAAPTVALVRVPAAAGGHEELQLRVNDQLIRRVSDQGVRPAEYQAATEELEQLASSLAAALGIEVWLRRADAAKPAGAAVGR